MWKTDGNHVESMGKINENHGIYMESMGKIMEFRWNLWESCGFGSIIYGNHIGLADSWLVLVNSKLITVRLQQCFNQQQK